MVGFYTSLKNSHYTILTFRKNKKKYPVNMNAVTGSKFVCNKKIEHYVMSAETMYSNSTIRHIIKNQ